MRQDLEVGGQEVAPSGTAVPARPYRFKRVFKGKGGDISLGAAGTGRSLNATPVAKDHPALGRGKRRSKYK